MKNTDCFNWKKVQVCGGCGKEDLMRVGLCVTCMRNDTIAERIFADIEDRMQDKDPEKPLRAIPGSLERIVILRRRAERGLPLFITGDCGWESTK